MKRILLLTTLLLFALTSFNLSANQTDPGQLVEYPGTVDKEISLEKPVWELKIIYSQHLDPDNFSVTANGEDVTKRFMPFKSLIGEPIWKVVLKLPEGENKVVVDAFSSHVNPDTGKPYHQQDVFHVTVSRNLPTIHYTIKQAPKHIPQGLSRKELVEYLRKNGKVIEKGKKSVPQSPKTSN